MHRFKAIKGEGGMLRCASLLERVEIVSRGTPTSTKSLLSQDPHFVATPDLGRLGKPRPQLSSSTTTFNYLRFD